MKGLILSGGKGTRLKPLTFTRAKQLMPVGNKPVLFRVIEAIRDAGVTDIGVVVGDTAPQIMAALDARPDLGVNLTYIVQDSPDGLAHAVKISRDFLGDDRFVVFLGDNVIQGGISDLIRQFAESDWNSQIVLKRVGMDLASLYGIATLREDGQIEKLIEKPKEPPTDLAVVGIYMFDHHVFEAVNAIKPSWRNELEITDAIQWLIDHDYRVFPHIHEGWWIDTGKSTEMLEANDHVLDELVPCISPEATIIDSRVDSRVTVEAGAQIINSVVRGPTIIGKNTVIRDSYVGPFTSIYHDVVVEDCEIEHSIVLEHGKILKPDVRIQDSLIGGHAKVARDTRKPRALKMNLGDHTTLWIPGNGG
jgi:glucose-1-phosphate thymidylyltransferase